MVATRRVRSPRFFAERKQILKLAGSQNVTYQEARQRIGTQFSDAVKRNLTKPTGPPSPPQLLGNTIGPAPPPTQRLDSMSRDISLLKSQFASLQQELHEIRSTPSEEVKQLQVSMGELYDVVSGLIESLSDVLPALRHIKSKLPHRLPLRSILLPIISLYQTALHPCLPILLRTPPRGRGSAPSSSADDK